MNKFIEIRDRGTFVPALAVPISGDDGYLARRAGFGTRMIYLIMLTAQKANYDAYAWDNRTLATAHIFIEENWDTLNDGDVVDVEFLRCETTSPKLSERFTCGE